MRSFGKNILPFLFLLLFFNNTFADTYLHKVKLEGSSSNTQYHYESVGPGCLDQSVWITQRVIDEYSTAKTTSYGSYLNCKRKTLSDVITTVSNDCSLSPPYATSFDSGEKCNEIPITSLTTLSLNVGSLKETFSLPGAGICAVSCSLPFEFGGFYNLIGESSLTLKINCQDEKTVKLLYIKAAGFITSEAQPTGMEFSVNGFSPSSVYPEDIQYYELYYVWSGVLKWKIPIDKKCGENITITPSVAGGYGQVAIGSIRAIDCEVDVDVFPSDVKPKKTGNNVTDITITLADSAPQGGQFVDLTVEAIEGSGGHNHNSSRSNHKGEITDNDGNKIDTLFFAEGETEKRAKYKASEIAGEEKIIAEIRGGLTKCEGTVNVKVPGLFGLGVGGSYRLTGSTGTHPANHYGTDSTIVSVNYMANDFYEQFNATLGINDMSLPGGGGFDIYGRWLDDITSPKCRQSGYGHCGHRIGTSVDIDRCALSATNPNNIIDQFCIGLGYPKGFIQVNRTAIEEICETHGGELEPEGTIHCEISGVGSLIIPPPPVGGGDTGGGIAQ